MKSCVTKIKQLKWIDASPNDHGVIMMASSPFISTGYINIAIYDDEYCLDVPNALIACDTIDKAKEAGQQWHDDQVNKLLEDDHDYVAVPRDGAVNPGILNAMFDATRKTSDLDQIFVSGVAAMLKYHSE